jgi:hypothetical protein
MMIVHDDDDDACPPLDFRNFRNRAPFTKLECQETLSMFSAMNKQLGITFWVGAIVAFSKEKGLRSVETETEVLE